MRRVRNPLADFIRDTERSAGSVARPFRPLMTPRSPELYTEKLKGVPFNLQLLIGEDYEDEDDSISLRERAEDLAERTGHHVVFVDINAAFASEGTEERGHPNRVSPYTPFTVLHRMFDSIMDGAGPNLAHIIPPDCGADYRQLRSKQGAFDWWRYKFAEELVQPRSFNERKLIRPVSQRLASAGVSTAAGRLQAFDEAGQVSADLFALKALTGRWGYDPSALPDMSGMPFDMKSWPPEMLRARMDYNAAARTFIYCLIEGLRYSPPQVFEI